MKTILISMEGFEETPEGDIRQFACEEHQLILAENEEFKGLIMLWKGEPIKVDTLPFQ